MGHSATVVAAVLSVWLQAAERLLNRASPINQSEAVIRWAMLRSSFSITADNSTSSLVDQAISQIKLTSDQRSSSLNESLMRLKTALKYQNR